MPVIETIMRSCYWCGGVTPHELWHVAEIHENFEGKDVTVFKRFYKCLRCDGKVNE